MTDSLQPMQDDKEILRDIALAISKTHKSLREQKPIREGAEQEVSESKEEKEQSPETIQVGEKKISMTAIEGKDKGNKKTIEAQDKTREEQIQRIKQTHAGMKRKEREVEKTFDSRLKFTKLHRLGKRLCKEATMQETVQKDMDEEERQWRERWTKRTAEAASTAITHCHKHCTSTNPSPYHSTFFPSTRAI